MKSYKQFVSEATGLSKIKRMGDQGSAKFTMRQAARAANKYGSDDTFKSPQMTKPVPSYYGIGAQFGVDTRKDEKGEYVSTPHTPTEDKALSGNPEIDQTHQELFKKTFMNILSKRKAL